MNDSRLNLLVSLGLLGGAWWAYQNGYKVAAGIMIAQGVKGLAEHLGKL